MPLLESCYQAPWYFRNGHIQSIAPALFRNIPFQFQRRERIETEDDDFLLIDWHQQKSDRCVVISHGLEGHSERAYVKGMAHHFSLQGWDVAAWNFRGCGGEANRQLRFYHSGASEDLALIIDHILGLHYQSIVLVGFSMGGNQTLKYLGERPTPERIKAAVTYSVPVSLQGCADALARPVNTLYMKRFLKDLRHKIADKARRFPEQVSLEGYDQIKDFYGFDGCYTAPMHGFKDAYDYWQQCSSLHYLDQIRIPTLLVKALDDPFLTQACFPSQIAKTNEHLYLETPRHGGHVGFLRRRINQTTWAEQRALEFCAPYIQNPK